MIIKIHNNKNNKLARILISVTILVAVFSYYAYYISSKINEGGTTFSPEVKDMAKKKKKSIKLQKSILGEAEKIISLVGANNIEKIIFSKKYLNIIIINDTIIEPLATRYGKMAKIEKRDDMWRVKLNMQKLITLKKEETLKIK